jgi:hypothetical protein
MLWVVRSYTNLSRKCDFRRFYCRTGVLPAIERLKLAGETPALHSESPKASCYWYHSSTSEQMSVPLKR